MKTDDLIAALSADAGPRPGVAVRMARALPPALGVAVAGLLLVHGVRPDLTAALTSAAAFKTLIPLVLTALAVALALALARPEGAAGKAGAGLLILGAGLALAFGAALSAGGTGGLVAALATPSLVTCLTSIPTLALPLLGAVLWALSAGAPQRPAISGALGGLLAGGLAAAVYSLYCDQDAVLFYLPAYGAAIVIVGAAGFLAGSRVLTW